MVGDEVHEVVVVTGEGRGLEALRGGVGAMPVVFHNGTPSGPVPFAPLLAAAAEAGLSFITYGRPGYGRSEPAPGRCVADAAADTAAILDHLGLRDCVALGWSGGGPHALACGALLPKRCRAVATIASAAPFDASGLDWMAGMAPENMEDFSLAAQGVDVLVPAIEAMAGAMASIAAADLADSLGGLLSDVDRASLTPEFAEWLASSFRKAFSSGIAGSRDDALAFVKPWGFDISTVAVPVAVWHGSQDLMVPPTHGRWLVDHLPDARAHLLSSDPPLRRW